MNTEKNCKMFFSVFFCLYGGTFDYMAFFEYNYGRNLKEVGNMREKKYYIAFDGYERGVIGALLRRAKIASSRRLEVGNFTMDADEHTAYLNDEEISLTNREFSILYKLLSYPKKTFTRMQLMDEFWDADTETAPRAVDVYMTKLRGKLAECEDFEIKTVHGLGYKAVIK